MNLSIIIPSFNENTRLTRTLEDLLVSLESNEFSAISQFNICIVDDGSENPISFSDVQMRFNEKINIYILRHLVNLGQGAALQTGVEYARNILNSDLYCTFDSDGQHEPRDLDKMIKSLLKYNVDIIFGNRFFKNSYSDIPQSRKFLLKLAIIFEYYLTGIKVNDSHNGYRLFNKKMAHVFHLKQARMAHATEIKIIVKKNKLKYAECHVNIKYSRENLEKGQRNIGALKIIRDIFTVYFFQK